MSYVQWFACMSCNYVSMYQVEGNAESIWNRERQTQPPVNFRINTVIKNLQCWIAKPILSNITGKSPSRFFELRCFNSFI